MRLLLFFISFLFFVIFYVFYHINIGKNIFGINLGKMKLETLSSNLLIESSIFLVIGIFLVIYFTPNFKPNFLLEKINKFTKYFYIGFFVIFFGLFFSGKIFYDTFVLFGILFFVFSCLCFNIISDLKYFKEQKESLRYFGLFLNFSSSFISLYYIFYFKFSVLLALILVFNIFFNYFIYQKYKNLACLGVVYTIIIFSLLFLILKIYYLLNFNLIFN